MMHERPPRPDQAQPLEAASNGMAAIDLQILSLLSQRFGLAGREGVSPELSEEERKAQLTLIRRRAFELGIPVGLVTDFWDRLLDASEAMQAQKSHRTINE
jgi:isochorismate pyruvate lyase